jgi:hypothetical protein
MPLRQGNKFVDEEFGKDEAITFGKYGLYKDRSSGKVDGWAENYYLTKCGNIITYMYYSRFHKSNLFWRFCPFSGKMAEISEKDEKTRSWPFWEISSSRM